MKKFPKGVVVAVLLLTAFAAFPRYSWAEVSARDIMEKNFFVSKIRQLTKDVTMTLVNDRGQTRERKITVTSKLQSNGVDSNLLVRFNSPPDIKGTAFLELEHLDGDDDLWIYLPALKKSRRLVAANKKDSFVGSDFSYGDVLPPRVDQYRHSLVRSEIIDGQDCYVIESLPANESILRDSGYNRKLFWIRKDNFHETKVDYYDVGGRLMKTQFVRNIKEVDPANFRWTASYREMVNHQTGHRTIFIAERYSTTTPIPDDLFTARSLERE